MENSLKLGIIGLISLLVIYGGSIYLNREQIGQTYYCPLTEEVGIFDRLSTSGKTGYYTNEDGLELSFPCRLGRVYEPWIPIKEYADMVGVPVEELIAPKEVDFVNQTMVNLTIINQTFVNQTVINQTILNQTDVVVIESSDTSGNAYYITNQTLISQILLNRSQWETSQPAPSEGKKWLCSPTGCMRIE